MPFTAVLIGDDRLTVQCGDRLRAAGHLIRAVVSDAPIVCHWAEAQGLPLHAPGPDLATRLGTLRCDWLLSIANLAVLPPDVLTLATRGSVNFHDGPLPRHAGLNAPVWALIEGATRHGIAWHMMDGGVDAGDLLLTRRFDIIPQDTALTLNTKVFAAALDSFDALLSLLELGAPDRAQQDLNLRSYHASTDRPAAGGVLDFARPAAELERLVRALDHGPYWNPLGLPKIFVGDHMWISTRAALEDSNAPAGMVVDVTDTSFCIACADGALRLWDLRDATGADVQPSDAAAMGDMLTAPEMAQMAAAVQAVAPFTKAWRRELRNLAAGTLRTAGAPTGQTHVICLADDVPRLGHIAVWAARLLGDSHISLSYADSDLCRLAASGIVAPWVPLTVQVDGTLDALTSCVASVIAKGRRQRGFARDLPLCDPTLAVRQPQIAISDRAGPVPGAVLTIERDDTGIRLHADSGSFTVEEATRLAARLRLLAGSDATSVADAPILPDTERREVLDRWNGTHVDHDDRLTMHAAFAAQAARTPEAIALICGGQQLSYAALEERANRAGHVLQSMGVGPDVIVGLFTHRSVEMMVGALAILKAGGAYLPLDPAFPANRLQHCIGDSAASVIVTHASLQNDLPTHTADVLVLDTDPRLSHAPVTPPDTTSGPGDLAYLLYTSGSTGTPKGVMIEHRNVANFFVGMDAVIPDTAGGTWLAVTSLSFDISVLELFWTTARGMRVVLANDTPRTDRPETTSVEGMQFSLFFWGNDDGAGPDRYKTLTDGAKFADDNGFVAVWTPERHFHAFGGAYPNPAVTGALVAGITRNIDVRAGSCVAPLHHPARIAEEWAVIDNLTNGRAGLAIASGWQPDDFVLRPENSPPDNKTAMGDTIETLRKLWRGEAVGFPRKDGSLHQVVTQPRPVTQELRLWITTAGNPDMWTEAGRLGANVLTHLLGQSLDEVAAKIALYHDALRAAGHDPEEFTVTLMVHTCLADTREAAHALARAPMKAYLRSAASLMQHYAWTFPAFKRPDGARTVRDIDLATLSADEMDSLLDFAFERYFTESGLFGTVEDARARVADFKRIGVGEVACLIDFGIAPDLVLDALKPLARVVASANAASDVTTDDPSLAAQITRHKVTHLQCTPSMAQMLIVDDASRQALSGVRHLFFGGEPLPQALVAEYATVTDATITNMYGPTETTIWSSTAPAHGGCGVADIGLPIANTQVYVLDTAQQPVPIGQEGELWIGGESVARGYWNRDALTAERFVNNPFHAGRMFRTGDLVRRRGDGQLAFVGRVDHQIKLRGFRIEPGEIEARLRAQPGITQAIVLTREDAPGDRRLIGYYSGQRHAVHALKQALRRDLPDYMVPQHLVWLDALPLTPNKKIDRDALPLPTGVAATAGQVARVRRAPSAASGLPANRTIETQVARIWTEVLGVQGIVAGDNFFDLGGHSLLAVQAHRALRDRMSVPDLSITDIFRFPQLGDLAARISALSGDPGTPDREDAGGDATARASTMARRRLMRARRRAGP